MSVFFAVSAFRDLPPARVVPEVVRYIESHGVSCRRLTTRGPVDHETDALVFEPVNSWTVVKWPANFNEHDERLNVHDVRLCAEVTRSTGSLAATVNIHDGDFWSFELIKAGALVDQFAPWSDYFATDAASAAAARSLWKGNPTVAAGELGVPPSLLQPYYRYARAVDAPGKAYADDEWSLDNFWVFTDLWRRIGITYPEEEEEGDFVDRVRMAGDFNEKLPTWEGEPL